jgi:hypothetical protein
LSSYYCADSGGIAPGSRTVVKVSEAPFGSSVVVRGTNVGNEGEQNIHYRIFGDVNPTWKLTGAR